MPSRALRRRAADKDEPAAVGHRHVDDHDVRPSALEHVLSLPHRRRLADDRQVSSSEPIRRAMPVRTSVWSSMMTTEMWLETA